MVQYAFMAIGLLVTVLNVLTFLALRRRVMRAFPKRGNAASIALGGLMLVLLHPFIFIMFGGISGLIVFRNELPQWLQITGMTFQMAMWLYGGVLLVTAAPRAFAHTFRKLRRMAKTEPSGTPPEREIINEARRGAITKAALALPAAIIATTIGGAIAARQSPRVTRLRLAVPREMTGLRGFTIAQVSDVHIGSYMDAERLDEIRDVMNSVKADIHVCTGDLLDNDIVQMEEAQRFLRGLNPRREVYMCVGNHEYIAARSTDTPRIVAGLRDSGVHLLIDETRRIEIGGDHFWLMGIDYPPQGGTHNVFNRVTDRTTDQSLDAVLKECRDDGAPRILLSHNPSTFNQARERPIDLTLSGHTHGGQLVLGRIGDANFSPVLPFELYHNGHYAHEGRQLYVNRGAGGWMPVRINCPPEISVIELV
jgi:predicted MPP superfamily phosphohydrolase